MILYTCSLSKWRVAKERGIPLFDVTIKSGDKHLAPDWDFLMDYKKFKDEDAYRVKFVAKMRDSYMENKLHWLGYCYMKEVVFACYCPEGCFCHRHLLVEMFDKVCKKNKIRFTRGGEL